MAIQRKPKQKDESQLDSHLLSFIEMRFGLAKHNSFYFKAKDIFEYDTIPNTKCGIQYIRTDVSNLGSYIKRYCDSDVNYKGIYRITTYIHRKHGSDLYKAELIDNGNK